MKNENFETCKRIVEELELYAVNSGQKCPDCGAIYPAEEYLEVDHDAARGNHLQKCPGCGAEVRRYDLEPLDLYDYFSDCLDIEYRIGSDKAYRSVSVMIACGGPNIYVDTGARAVLLYWGGDRAEYPIRSDALDAVDDWAEDYWNNIL